MRFKKISTDHRPLCRAVFWDVMWILVLLYFPRDMQTYAEMRENQVKMESPQVVVVEEETTESQTTELLVIEPESEINIEEEPTPVEEGSIEMSEAAKPPRYGFTDDEIYLMSVLLTGSKDVDGDGEFDFDYGRQDEYDQISLVLCVVMNRVRSELFPNTVEEVIWAKNQFAPMRRWANGLPEVSDISLQRVTEWCEAYDAYSTGVQSIPENHLYFHGDGIQNHSR